MFLGGSWVLITPIVIVLGSQVPQVGFKYSYNSGYNEPPSSAGKVKEAASVSGRGSAQWGSIVFIASDGTAIPSFALAQRIHVPN